jgi:DNA-binding LytR/AlgR family response regulator
MKKIRVLIVEDNAMASKAIAITLEKYSLDPAQVCETGEEALRYFEDNDVDLVLMDIVLAGKMDGITTAQNMRKLRQVPVIYLSDHVDEGKVARAKQTYPANYLSKPYNEAELVRAIELAFNNTQEPRASRPKSSGEDVFLRTDNQKFIRIGFKEVLYIKADRSYCKVITDKNTYMMCSSMKEVHEKFDNADFIKVHRSYVVNTKRITKLDGNIIYIDENKVDIGKEFRENLLSALKLIK